MKHEAKLAKLLLVNASTRKSSYLLRLVAGGYLLYLMYQLFGQTGSSEPLTPLMIAAGVLLVAAGVYFVVSALYAFSHGIYEENESAELADEKDHEPEAGNQKK